MGFPFLIACSAPSALCYAILAVSPQSVIPSGAKFESRTSYLRSMRFLNFMRYANPFEPSEPKEVAAHSSLIVRGGGGTWREAEETHKRKSLCVDFLFLIYII